MKIYLLLVASLVSSLILLSCKKGNPISSENQPQVKLSIIETASTEVWLKVETKNISLPAHFNLLKNDSISRPVYMEESEIKLYVTALLPNCTYKFKVTQTANDPIESNTVTIETLDTTSNEITWQAYEFSNTMIGDASLAS